jgi:hypothetical protein
MTSIDTNISNYTISELMTIIELNDDEINKEDIISKTNMYIKKFKNKNPELSVFFKEVQFQLLQYAEGLDDLDDDEDEEDEDNDKIMVEGFGTMNNEAIYYEGEKQISEWYHNENLTQNDANQTNKITQRKQKVGFFGNQHDQMKQR